MKKMDTEKIELPVARETRATPNDLKLSDSGVRRGTCMVGGKAAVEAGAVTHGAVRCSAWLGVAAVGKKLSTRRPHSRLISVRGTTERLPTQMRE